MSDDPESSADDELSIDADSIAPTNSPAGRQSVPCPRCDTPIALVVSYGPLTHKASPCGCRVSRRVLEVSRTDAE